MLKWYPIPIKGLKLNKNGVAKGETEKVAGWQRGRVGFVRDAGLGTI